MKKTIRKRRLNIWREVKLPEKKMNYYDKSLKMHKLNSGKLEVRSKIPVKDKEDLSTAYTPGVAGPCIEIDKNPEDAYKYTVKANTVAVVSDGSAVLGLGNIGGLASLPVMEGKAILFKEFGGVDAFPICLDTQNVDEIVETVKNIAPTFGGINLEDISAPRCFEVENRLKDILDIPVFHDDQHGTAIVVSAAIINSCKLVNKKIENISVAISGAGAAGTAIVKMLSKLGVRDIVVCDIDGIINTGRMKDLDSNSIDLLELTNKQNLQGGLKEAIEARDVFIGVSAPNIVTEEMINSMNEDAIVFAMANPEPEIMPDLAKAAGARVVGTGRSDFDNQINNVLVFPGIFKGALSARAEAITEDMKVAAAHALANLVSPEELSPEYVIPDSFHEGVADAIASAVENSWYKVDGEEQEDNT